jgi:protein-tyrosine phosphatase
MTSETFNILFVCSGNSCRSPIAEGLMKTKLTNEFRERVTVDSAGTLGLDGNPATDFAIHVASELGADISQHRSRGISEELVKDADIIFAMTPEHQAYLEKAFPEVRDNVFLLKTFDRQPGEEFDEFIDDPIGGTLAVYRECARIINEELERILPRLARLIEEKMGKGYTD